MRVCALSSLAKPKAASDNFWSVDPIAESPVFLAMTQDYSFQIRRALGWRVALNSLVLMVSSHFVGAHVLNFLGSRPRLCRSAAV